MNKHWAILVAALFSTAAVPAFAGCEDGLSIRSVTSDGEIVVLDDGSVWKIDSVDSIDSALWLPMTSIVACDNKLINTDDDESVDAEKIH